MVACFVLCFVFILLVHVALGDVLYYFDGNNTLGFDTDGEVYLSTDASWCYDPDPYCIQLYGNSTLYSPTYSTLNYHSIILKYTMIVQTIEAGDYCASFYSVNNAAWTYTGFQALESDNGIFKINETFLLPSSAANQANVKFAFHTSNGISDYCYIDDIYVLGTPITSDPTQAPTMTPIDAPSGSPSSPPTNMPTRAPSFSPIDNPTAAPIVTTIEPITSTITTTIVTTDAPSLDTTTTDIITSTTNAPETTTTQQQTSTEIVDSTSTEYTTIASTSSISTSTLVSISTSEIDLEQSDDYKTLKNQLDITENTFQIVALALIALFLIIIIVSCTDARWLRSNDYFRVSRIISVLFESLDMLSDVFWTISVSHHYHRNPSKYMIPFFASLCFIILPISIGQYQLYHAIRKHWLKVDHVRSWLKKRSKPLYLISIITGSPFAAIDLVNSNILSFPAFDMGLTDEQIISFRIKRVYSVVLFENVPQLSLQVWYLITTGPSLINIVAMVTSVISITLSVFSFLIRKSIINSQEYMLVTFKVSGKYVTANAAKCIRMKRGIQKDIATVVGVPANVVHLSKPETIPLGLKLTLTMDINGTQHNCAKYRQALEQAQANGTLADIMMRRWKLMGAPVVSGAELTRIESKNEMKNTVVVKIESASADFANMTTSQVELMRSHIEFQNVQMNSNANAGSPQFEGVVASVNTGNTDTGALPSNMVNVKVIDVYDQFELSTPKMVGSVGDGGDQSSSEDIGGNTMGGDPMLNGQGVVDNGENNIDGIYDMNAIANNLSLPASPEVNPMYGVMNSNELLQLQNSLKDDDDGEDGENNNLYGGEAKFVTETAQGLSTAY